MKMIGQAVICGVLALIFSKHPECFLGIERAGQTPSGASVNSDQSYNDKPVDGRYLGAFLIAYNAFKDQAQIPVEKRRLENYQLYFREDSDNYYVVFLAKSKVYSPSHKGGETELGRDVEYVIDKTKLQVVAFKFFV